MGSRIREVAPSAVSATSMFLGLASVALSATGRVELAAWFVIYCTFLDKADGTLARALKVSSRFGMEMDSYSDFTAFGIAPAALVWFGLTDGSAVPVAWVGFASLTWVLLTAIRLARFNLDTDGERDTFTGVPTTLAAGIYASLYLTLFDFDLLRQWGSAMVPIALALAVLMVGHLRIPKIKPRKSRAYNGFQGSMILVALIVALLQTLPVVLLVLSFGYLVIGGLVSLRKPAAADGESG